MRPFQLDPLAVVSVLATNDLVDEAAVGVESVEVSGTTQQQRVLQRFFQMAMRAFNGPVLVGDAGVRTPSTITTPI